MVGVNSLGAKTVNEILGNQVINLVKNIPD